MRNEQKHNLEFPDDSSTDKENRFDWTASFLKLKAMRKAFVKAGFLGILIGLVIAFSLPKKYTVTVSLAPEMNDLKVGGGLASMAASFLGSSAMQSTPDALNVLLSSNIVSSTPFLLDLLESRVVTSEGTTDVLTTYLEDERGPWWGYIMQSPRLLISGIKSLIKGSETSLKDSVSSGPISLNEKVINKLNTLRSVIQVEVDTKSQITTLSVTLQDPKVTAIVADSVVNKLQNAIINYRISKAKEDSQYWEKLCVERKEEYLDAQKRYSKFVDSNNNLVYQSTMAESERLRHEMDLTYQVYSQVMQQLQMARAKVQEEKPVFAVIEPSIVPLLPSSVSKVTILLVSLIMSLGVTFLWKFYGGYQVYLKVKNLFLNS